MKSLALMLLLLIPVAARAHNGRLDEHGCHKDPIQANRAKGGYHCHKGPMSGEWFMSREAMLREKHRRERHQSPGR